MKTLILLAFLSFNGDFFYAKGKLLYHTQPECVMVRMDSVEGKAFIKGDTFRVVKNGKYYNYDPNSPILVVLKNNPQ